MSCYIHPTPFSLSSSAGPLHRIKCPISGPPYTGTDSHTDLPVNMDIRVTQSNPKSQNKIDLSICVLLILPPLAYSSLLLQLSSLSVLYHQLLLLHSFLSISKKYALESPISKYTPHIHALLVPLQLLPHFSTLFLYPNSSKELSMPGLGKVQLVGQVWLAICICK